MYSQHRSSTVGGLPAFALWQCGYEAKSPSLAVGRIVLSCSPVFLLQKKRVVQLSPKVKLHLLVQNAPVDTDQVPLLSAPGCLVCEAQAGTVLFLPSFHRERVRTQTRAKAPPFPFCMAESSRESAFSRVRLFRNRPGALGPFRARRTQQSLPEGARLVALDS